MNDTTLYPQIPRWSAANPPPRIIRDQPLQETSMPDQIDYAAIIRAAAERVIRDDENKYAGAWKRLIPESAPHNLAVEIANAAAADIAKAQTK